ncbi:MAG TPA: ATP-binding protein [Gemmatimonadaceae bacterium]|nr:ATP-binding protein [Gemmatimonadaceae bacterium]
MKSTVPPSLIDRTTEQSELRALLDGGTHKLALLTGRRRVGKTFLINHLWPSERLFLFTAARTTPEVNRRQLLQDLARWSGEEIQPEDYPTWRAVFRLLLTFRAPEPLVVALDEFQYFADGDTGVAAVASELNAVWEEQRPERPFVLILSGSAVGTMEALAAGGAPLYGRFDWRGRLGPFTYWYAAELAPFPDRRDRAVAYGIFGGTPRYLALIDATRPLADVATGLMLDPHGEVRLLVDSALDQEDGLRDAGKYRAIVQAVAQGQTERNEIAQRAGLQNDNGLRDKLARLVELGYLEERRNIDAKPNELIRYGVADAAFRFYHQLVAPNLSLLERYPADEVWAEVVAPVLDRYMGLEFERIVVQSYDRRRGALGLPMVREWGRWEGTDRMRKSLEIDIVAPLTDGRVMTGAVKWNRDPVSPTMHYAHLAMLERAADAGRSWAHQALKADAPLLYVAANGFTPGFAEAVAESGHPTMCWTLEEVYA